MRNRTPLSGPVATLLQRLALDKETFDLPNLPPVIGGHWGDVALDGLWGPLSVDGPELVWEVNVTHGAGGDVESRLAARIEGLRNAPASLHLADGTRVQAKFGHWTRWGTRVDMPPGYTCDFNIWNVEGPLPARWVGKLHGGGFLNANLSVAGPGPTRSSSHMRLDGRYTWYILDRRHDGGHLDVVVDGGTSPLDQEALRTDFNALQFAFGAPMQLDTLVALDDPGNVVGCAGVHLGGNRRTEYRRRADGPVPDDVSDECWVPVLFGRLARAMVSTDLPWSVACGAYLDSVSDSTIDGKYLKLHVALEAFAKALLEKSRKGKTKKERKKETPRLVKDAEAWVKWVKGHGDELRSMVADGASPQVFVDKVISAMNIPSSGVVADALTRLHPPLVVEASVLDELDDRNIPAHYATMNKPGVDYDIDRDTQRVDILRSLLVALVARACGYDGAIAGWVTDNAAGWKPQPGWWPAPPPTTTEEARTAFFSERGPAPRPRHRVSHSRLRTKKKQQAAGRGK